MTEASAGLRKALARKAGVSKLTPDELLAEMSDEQKIALAASLTPAANAAEAMEPEEDEEEMEDGKKKPKTMKKDKNMDEDEDMKAKAATDRAIAVLSHEHAQGRMDVATGLLANDKLSADEIITVLAAMDPAEKPDPEAAARAEMQAALNDNANSEIEANDGAAPKTKANAANVWDAAYAKVFGTNNVA